MPHVVHHCKNSRRKELSKPKAWRRVEREQQPDGKDEMVFAAQLQRVVKLSLAFCSEGPEKLDKQVGIPTVGGALVCLCRRATGAITGREATNDETMKQRLPPPSTVFGDGTSLQVTNSR